MALPALDYIMDYGVPDESCMPYVDGSGCSCDGGTCKQLHLSVDACSDRTCSNRCSDWSSRLEHIDSTGAVSANQRAIKPPWWMTVPWRWRSGSAHRMAAIGMGISTAAATTAAPTMRSLSSAMTTREDIGGCGIVGDRLGANGYFQAGLWGVLGRAIGLLCRRQSAAGDAYEPDGSWGQAKWISSGSPQAHSMCPGEQMWTGSPSP